MTVYKFTVNGQELESKSEKLVALDIIKLAEQKGVPLPDKPENLLLEAVGEGQPFKLDDWVDLEKFTDFILIPVRQHPSLKMSGIERITEELKALGYNPFMSIIHRQGGWWSLNIQFRRENIKTKLY